VTPRVKALNGYLYESPLLSQMCMVFDASKALQGTCDAWPKPIKCKKVCVVPTLYRFLLTYIHTQ
jgi:Tripeptidyl peptidase II